MHQLKYYGDDVIVEMREADDDRFRSIMESLRPEIRAKIIGYRKVVAIADPLTTPEEGS